MWDHYRRRTLISVTVGGIVYLVVVISPAVWDSALLLGWDAGVTAWLFLTYRRIRHADAQATMNESRALEPATRLVLIVMLITATVGIWGAIALTAQESGRGTLAQHLHVGAGLMAVFGAWLLAHVEFARYYARLYYDEVDGGTGSAAPGAPQFHKGLAFPSGDLLDYWDFMYFSFAIAMCYQAPDVTITTPWMRRVVLFHAVLSFAFVLLILGFVVNAIGNVL